MTCGMLTKGERVVYTKKVREIYVISMLCLYMILDGVWIYTSIVVSIEEDKGYGVSPNTPKNYTMRM